MYGHVEKLAEEIKKGAASVEGVEAQLWQVCVHVSFFLFCIFSYNKSQTVSKVKQFCPFNPDFTVIYKVKDTTALT